MKTQEAVKIFEQLQSIYKDNNMQGIFIAAADPDKHMVCYPGHDDDIDSICRQLYVFATSAPKSHLGTIILNVAAAICVSSPIIEQEFYNDLERKRSMLS